MEEKKEEKNIQQTSADLHSSRSGSIWLSSLTLATWAWVKVCKTSMTVKCDKINAVIIQSLPWKSHLNSVRGRLNTVSQRRETLLLSSVHANIKILIRHSRVHICNIHITFELCQIKTSPENTIFSLTVLTLVTLKFYPGHQQLVCKCVKFNKVTLTQH